MIYQRFTKNKKIFSILLSKYLPRIYHRFTTNLPRIYQRFTTNKKIFSILLSKYLPRIYHRFTTNLPRIYQRFTKSTKHLPTAYQQLPKYFFNLPRIYHRFTNTILELNIFVLELSIVKDDDCVCLCLVIIAALKC